MPMLEIRTNIFTVRVIIKALLLYSFWKTVKFPDNLVSTNILPSVSLGADKMITEYDLNTLKRK